MTTGLGLAVSQRTEAINFRLFSQRLAKETTRWIGIYRGESFPFYYVSEHPKSGGSWLAKMVADYLQLPFPQFARLPLAFSCVLLNHWPYHPRMRRVFYLYRDGRDVMTSLYFDRIRIARYSQSPGRAKVARTYERLFGKDYDPGDVVQHMPRFLEHEFTSPGGGTRLNWRDHIESWYRREGSSSIAYLSYEELRRDCADTLGRAIETITGGAPDPWRLETAIEKMSMKRQTNREPGEEDISSHTRKAIVGDWQSSFSREAAEIFDERAGDALVELGYEADRSWVGRYTYPTP